MRGFKKGLSALVISSIAVGGYFAGTGLVRDVRFAQAQEQVQSSREELQKVDDIYGVYRNVGKAVEPSVVSIEVHKTVKNVHRSLPFDDETLKRFFPDRDGDGEPDVPRRFRTPGGDGTDEFDQVAGGSGVVMEASDGKGYVLTNNHVAGGAESM